MSKLSNACCVSVGGPEGGGGPLGRRRGLWDNVRVDLGFVWCGVVDWIRLVRDGDQ
jgi:hypothetical protein